MEFKRKFSFSMFKNLKLKLGEMSFSRDFVNGEYNNLYPVIENSDASECVFENRYYLNYGGVKRWFCSFFPYASYEMTAVAVGGKFGFTLNLPDAEAEILTDGEYLFFNCGNDRRSFDLPDFLTGEITLIVTCRPSAFDIYFKRNGKAEFFKTIDAADFENSNDYNNFSNGSVAVNLNGTVAVSEVVSYIDNGIAQADMRPIRYENGDLMLENGKVYMTVSIRLPSGGYQAIYSWVPGTAALEMTGVVFFDCGDSRWCGDIASSLLYHREKKLWYLWLCSFSHGHLLAHSAFQGDIRFGLNVVDVTLMNKAENEDRQEFAGFEGDEDPDFFYEEKNNKWLMAICRTDTQTKRYKYYFFESENPFDGYKFIGKGVDGSETGGSFVKINGEQAFTCGNGFKIISEYRIYTENKLETVRFDYPDGGYRGWGTLIPVKMGSRTRYFWWTFDRHKASDNNTWSYGNLYCFEAV